MRLKESLPTPSGLLGFRACPGLIFVVVGMRVVQNNIKDKKRKKQKKKEEGEEERRKGRGRGDRQKATWGRKEFIGLHIYDTVHH